MTRLFILLALLLPSVACDQAAKLLAVEHLRGKGVVHVVDGFVKLVYAENPGTFLGLGRALPDSLRYGIFTLGAALVLLAVAWVLVRKTHAPAVFLGLALLVAGGAGNLVDRVARPGGRVVDFAQLSMPTPWGGHLQTGVFNVADVQIMAGAALLAFATWKGRKRDDVTATSR